jgi:hypothetical protein
MRVGLPAVLAVAFMLALGGTALAQDSPTGDAYGGVLGEEVQNTADTTADTPPPATTTNQVEVGASEGSLPFTGLEIAVVALAGLGLVGLGFAMRRGTRRPTA